MNKEIKQGYKQTKVGIIPEDWEVVKLGKVTKINPNNKNLPENFIYIDLESVVKGKLLKQNFISKYEAPSRAQRVLKKNDILFQMVRPYQMNNLFFEFDGNYVASTGYAQIRTNQSDKYIFQYIHLKRFVDKVLEKCTGSNYPAINSSDLSDILIILPPLKEQEKIAEILTTWDEAITKQTELLEAKELQKKALMQKLLSGEVRFDGFNDEWEDIRLGKYIKEISKKNKENIDLVLSVTNKHGFIAQKDYFDKEVASKNTSNYKIVKRGNFAYNPSRINVGSLGLLEEYEIGILSPMYVIFECLKGLNKEYLNYWLNTHNFTGNFYKFLSGSVRDSLAFNDMKLMKIKLPVLKEQEKIVEVLSLVDKEIDLLKKELEELKLQKKAVMQKLLTGQVRVKV